MTAAKADRRIAALESQLDRAYALIRDLTARLSIAEDKLDRLVVVHPDRAAAPMTYGPVVYSPSITGPIVIPADATRCGKATP